MTEGPGRRELDRRWFERRRDVFSWVVVVTDLALVFAGVLAGAAIGPKPVAVLAWLWFGLTFPTLLNLIHECAHRLAFRKRRSSDALGRWVLGPLALADFDAYRRRHWAHHRNLGVDGDTKDAYLVDIGGARFFRLLLRCLCLREAVRKFTRQSPSTDEELPLGEGVGLGRALARTALVQALLLASITTVASSAHDGVGPVAASVAVAYGCVYLYGLASLTVFAATLRAIAEHQLGPGTALSEGRAALRNFSAGPFGRLVFGSYGFANHATHHREPGIPHYRLPTVTAALALGEPALSPRQGYVATLWRLGRTRRRPPLPVPA